MNRPISLLLFAFACATPAVGAHYARVAGEAAGAEAKSGRIEAFRLPGFPVEMARRVGLTPLAGMAKQFVSPPADDLKRLRVGSRRDVEAETESLAGPAAVQWLSAPGGGHSARWIVASPEAASLRLGIDARGLPPGAELRVAGIDDPGRVLGPIAGAVLAEAARVSGVFWTPLTEGASQVMELWIPDGADPAAVSLRVATASHVVTRPSDLAKSATRGGLGAAQACHPDVVCVASANAAVAQAARSVAKLVYTEGGTTYLCSGTLLNDGDATSQVPYVFTAAHCIGSQAAAATLNSFWFFEASACGSHSAQEYRQLTGGATMLYANGVTDASLLRLKERAPEGAWFSGWDAAPLEAGSPLVALHHPAGDVKKLSLGLAMPATLNSFTTAAWSTGSTEGGSSGSGIFTLAGGEYHLRGALRGGSASCDSSGRIADPANRDYYSRLDLEGTELAKWLSAEAAPLEDYTDMWWNPAEPGWGVSLVQNASNHVFATWFIHDDGGRPTWLAMPEGRWKGAARLEGALYRTAGTAPDGEYDASRFRIDAVGSARIDFGTAGDATVTLTFDGRTVTRPLRRLAY